MRKLLITIGLPASGKTTWAKHYCKENNVRPYCSSKPSAIALINLDNQDAKETIRQYTKYGYNELILDGLFLTNTDIIKLFDIVKTLSKVKTIELHYWKPDISACLWNDRYRRSTNSQVTINHAQIEPPDIELLKEHIKDAEIKVVEHEVVRKSKIKMFADKYKLYIDDCNMGLRSDSWCLGGNYRDCWGGDYLIGSSPLPASYQEFDALLEQICPNITFMQYKKIYNSCVETDTYTENDYYGGSTSHGYFRCNVETLYNKLVELNLINDEELCK
jgi:hypothetical protein